MHLNQCKCERDIHSIHAIGTVLQQLIESCCQCALIRNNNNNKSKLAAFDMINNQGAQQLTLTKRRGTVDVVVKGVW